MIDISLKTKGEAGSIKIGNKSYDLIFKDVLGEGSYGEVQKYALHSKEEDKKFLFELALKFGCMMKNGEHIEDDEKCALEKLKENKCSIANARSTRNDEECEHYITLMPLMDGSLYDLRENKNGFLKE